MESITAVEGVSNNTSRWEEAYRRAEMDWAEHGNASVYAHSDEQRKKENAEIAESGQA